jgi:predicted NAD-dependent protein-ADP-ribosyltransferase YbiA (DUF1768 family)
MPPIVDTRTALDRLLSNMHKLDAPLMDRFGLAYPTVEHAYQAAKTLNPKERETILKLLGSSDQWYGLPAKAAGRRVTLDPSWDKRKVEVMRQLLGKKFEQLRFAEALRSTGTTPIVEVDPMGRDLFWAQSPTGQGRNELGKMLEAIRTLLFGGKVAVQSQPKPTNTSEEAMREALRQLARAKLGGRAPEVLTGEEARQRATQGRMKPYS